MCFPPQQSALFRYRNFQKIQKLFETVSCSHFSVANVLCATAACTFSRPELPKVARDRQFLTLLTSECASRRALFNIATSKIGPRPLVFNTFHLEMCFAPQWPAFFQHHLKFQNCSDNGVFCTFWLRRVLLATMPCSFCASQLPKVLRAWCALSILASKCASCHNIAPFQQLNFQKCLFFSHFHFQMCFAPQRRAIFDLISPDSSPPAALASLLFDPPEPQNIARLFYLFARIDLLSFESFSSLIFFLLPSLLWLFPPLLFHVSMLSILSEVWLPNILWQFIYLKLYWYIIRIYYTLCMYIYIYMYVSYIICNVTLIIYIFLPYGGSSWHFKNI